MDPTTRKCIYIALLIVTVSIIAVKGALVVRSVNKGEQRDYPRWYRIGQRSLEGKTLASPAGAAAVAASDEAGEETFYKLPPAWAVYISPLALLPYKAYVVAYYLLDALAGALCMLLAMKLLHGRFLPENPLWMLIPAALVLPCLLDDVHLGNNNNLVLAAFMAGAAIAVRCNIGGGVMLGLAVSLKAFPAAAVAALGTMRRWRLVFWSIVGALLFTLILPMLFRGPDNVIKDNWNWAQRILMPYLKGAEKVQWQRKGISLANQSLWGTLNRFLRHEQTNAQPAAAATTLASATQASSPTATAAAKPARKGSSGFDRKVDVSVANLTSKQTALVWLALLALAGGGMFWASLRKGEQPRWELAMDMALASNFVLLASPLAFTYFFSQLLLPMAVAAWLAFASPSGPMRKLCIAALAATPVLELLGLWQMMRAYGVLTWLGVMWFVVMLIVRRHALSPALVGQNEPAKELSAQAVPASTPTA